MTGKVNEREVAGIRHAVPGEGEAGAEQDVQAAVTPSSGQALHRASLGTSSLNNEHSSSAARGKPRA